MRNYPKMVSAALALVLVNALIWLALGIIIAAGAHPALPDSSTAKTIMALLSFGAAIVLGALFILLRKQNSFAYYLALASFLVSIGLTITDQFGWVDLVVLIITLLPLVLLIKERGWFIQTRPRPAANN